MRTIRLIVPPAGAQEGFRVRQLGLREGMRPGMVNRPRGTGDYLLMLFHSPVIARDRDGVREWPASSLVIWSPKDGHYYGSREASWDHSWLHCTGGKIAAILRASRLPLNRRITVGEPSALEKCLLEMVAELRGNLEPDATILQNHFENYIRTLARALYRPAEVKVPGPLLAVRSTIEQRFNEPLRLEELARSAGWSTPHLCAEFKRFFGLPAIRYLQQLRMNRAAYLLRDRNLRIGEIAVQVGYPDLYTFSKMLKRHFGVSPRKLRERIEREPPGCVAAIDG